MILTHVWNENAWNEKSFYSYDEDFTEQQDKAADSFSFKIHVKVSELNRGKDEVRMRWICFL